MASTKIFIIAWLMLGIGIYVSRGNKDLCQQQADSAFQFLHVGEAINKENCYDLCCQHKKCEVAILSGTKCFGIHCARKEVCNLISEQLSSFEGHRVDKRSVDDMDDDWAGESDGDIMQSAYNEGNIDDNKADDTNTGNVETKDDDQQSCHSPHFHHSFIPRRKNSFLFSNLHSGKISLLDCSEQCCKIGDCVLAFLIAKTCYGVICSGEGNCHSLRDHLPRRSIFVSTVSKVMNKLGHHIGNKREYNVYTERETGQSHHHQQQHIHNLNDDDNDGELEDVMEKKKEDESDQHEVKDETSSEKHGDGEEDGEKSDGEAENSPVEEDDTHEIQKKSEIIHEDNEGEDNNIESDNVNVEGGDEEHEEEKSSSIRHEHAYISNNKHTDVTDEEEDSNRERDNNNVEDNYKRELEKSIVHEHADPDDEKNNDAGGDDHDGNNDDELRKKTTHIGHDFRHVHEDSSGNREEDVVNTRHKRHEHERHHEKHIEETHKKPKHHHKRYAGEPIHHVHNNKHTSKHHKGIKKTPHDKGVHRRHGGHKKVKGTKKHKIHKKKKKNSKKKKKKTKKKKQVKQKHATKHEMIPFDEGSGEERYQTHLSDDDEFSGEGEKSEHKYIHYNSESYKRDNIPSSDDGIKIERERPNAEMLDFSNNGHDKNSQINDDKMSGFSWDKSLSKESVAKPMLQEGYSISPNETFFSEVSEGDQDSGDNEFELPHNEEVITMAHNPIRDQDQGSGLLLNEDDESTHREKKKHEVINKDKKKHKSKGKSKHNTDKEDDKDIDIMDKITLLDSMTEDVVNKKQKLEPAKLLNLVAEVTQEKGGSKGGSNAKHKGNTKGTKDNDNDKKKSSQEDSLLKKMVKELENLNPSELKKGKTPQPVQKHNEPHPKKKHDETHSKSKQQSAKRNEIEHIIDITEMANDLESGSGSGTPFILDSPKNPKQLTHKARPKKVKHKHKIVKDKDTIPTPADLLKIHEDAQKALKHKEAIEHKEDIFKEFGSKLKSLSKVHTMIEGDKDLEAVGKFEVSGDNSDDLESLADQLKVGHNEKGARHETSVDIMSNSTKESSEKNTKKKSKATKTGKTTRTHLKSKVKSNKNKIAKKSGQKGIAHSHHRKKSKNNKSVINNSITTRKPYIATTAKPRFSIIGGALTPSGKSIVTVPDTVPTVSVDSVTASVLGTTVTQQRTVPTVAVDGSSATHPTEIPSKKVNKHKALEIIPTHPIEKIPTKKVKDLKINMPGDGMSATHPTEIPSKKVNEHKHKDLKTKVKGKGAHHGKHPGSPDHKIPTLNIEVGDEVGNTDNKVKAHKTDKSHKTDKKKEKSTHKGKTTIPPTTTIPKLESTLSPQDQHTVGVIINNHPTPFAGTIKVHLSTSGPLDFKSTSNHAIVQIVTTPEYKVPRVNDPYIIQAGGPTLPMPAVINGGMVSTHAHNVAPPPFPPIFNQEIWKKLMSYMQKGRPLTDLKNVFMPTSRIAVKKSPLKPAKHVVKLLPLKPTKTISMPTGGFIYDPITGVAVDDMPDNPGEKKLDHGHNPHKGIVISPHRLVPPTHNHVLPKPQTHDLSHHVVSPPIMHHPAVNRKPIPPLVNHLIHGKPDPALIHDLVLSKPEPSLVSHLIHGKRGPTTTLNHLIHAKPGPTLVNHLLHGKLGANKQPGININHPNNVPFRHTTAKPRQKHTIKPFLRRPPTAHLPAHLVHMPTHRLAHVALLRPSLIKRLPTPHHTTPHHITHHHTALHYTTRHHITHRHTTRSHIAPHHTTRHHNTHHTNLMHHTTKKRLFNQFANHHYPTPTRGFPTSKVQHVTHRHTTRRHTTRHHNTRHHTTKKLGTPPHLKLVKNAFQSNVNHPNHPTIANHPNVLVNHPNVLNRPTVRNQHRKTPTKPVIQRTLSPNIHINGVSITKHEIHPLLPKKETPLEVVNHIVNKPKEEESSSPLDSFFSKPQNQNPDKHDVIEHNKHKKTNEDQKTKEDEHKKRTNDDGHKEKTKEDEHKEKSSEDKHKEKGNEEKQIEKNNEDKLETFFKPSERKRKEVTGTQQQKRNKESDHEIQPANEKEKSYEDLFRIRGCNVINDVWGKEFASKPGYLFRVSGTMNSSTCARKCCHHDTCHVAYYKNRVCSLVQCSNRSACANVMPSHQNTRIVYFNKNAMDGNQHYCEKNFAIGVPWDKTRAGESAMRDCPRNAYGKAKRYCDIYSKWELPDFSKCISQEYSDLKEKMRGLGYTTSAKSLLEELDDVTTQTIDNSLIFGGDIMKATETISGVTSFLQKTKAEEIDHKDLKSFTRAISNLLDETNKQEWLNLKPRSFGPSKLMSSLESMGLYTAERLKRSAEMKPVVTHTIILQVAKIPQDPLGEPFTFPNYSVSVVNQWSPRKDTIILPFSVFNTDGDTTIAASNYKSLGFMLPHRWNTKKAVTFTDGFVVNSNVLSCAIKPKPKHGITPPITITLHHIKEMNYAESKCVYWDFSAGNSGSWSTDGCWLSKSNRSTTICKCNHLTHFAVLSNTYDQKVNAKEQSKEKAMAIVWLGIPLSIILMVGALYMCFSWSKDPRRRHVVLIDKKPNLPRETTVETPVVSEKFEPSPKRYLYAANTKICPPLPRSPQRLTCQQKWVLSSPSKSSKSSDPDQHERNGFTTPSDLEWELTWDYLANAKYSESEEKNVYPEPMKTDTHDKAAPSECTTGNINKWNYQDDTEWSENRIKCARRELIESTDNSETATDHEVYNTDDDATFSSQSSDVQLSSVFRPVGISSPHSSISGREEFSRSKSLRHGKNYLRISFDADIDSSGGSSRQSGSLQGSDKGSLQGSDRGSLHGSDKDLSLKDLSLKDLSLKDLSLKDNDEAELMKDLVTVIVSRTDKCNKYDDACKSLCVDIVLLSSSHDVYNCNLNNSAVKDNTLDITSNAVITGNANDVVLNILSSSSEAPLDEHILNSATFDESTFDSHCDNNCLGLDMLFQEDILDDSLEDIDSTKTEFPLGKKPPSPVEQSRQNSDVSELDSTYEWQRRAISNIKRYLLYDGLSSPLHDIQVCSVDSIKSEDKSSEKKLKITPLTLVADKIQNDDFDNLSDDSGYNLKSSVSSPTDSLEDLDTGSRTSLGSTSTDSFLSEVASSFPHRSSTSDLTMPSFHQYSSTNDLTTSSPMCEQQYFPGDNDISVDPIDVVTNQIEDFQLHSIPFTCTTDNSDKKSDPCADAKSNTNYKKTEVDVAKDMMSAISSSGCRIKRRQKENKQCHTVANAKTARHMKSYIALRMQCRMNDTLQEAETQRKNKINKLKLKSVPTVKPHLGLNLNIEKTGPVIIEQTSPVRSPSSPIIIDKPSPVKAPTGPVIIETNASPVKSPVPLRSCVKKKSRYDSPDLCQLNENIRQLKVFSNKRLAQKRTLKFATVENSRANIRAKIDQGFKSKERLAKHWSTAKHRSRQFSVDRNSHLLNDTCAAVGHLDGSCGTRDIHVERVEVGSGCSSPVHKTVHFQL